MSFPSPDAESASPLADEAATPAAHGYVKISRRAYEDDPYWREKRVFSRWETWEFLIKTAAFKPRRFCTGTRVDVLNRGEFVASIRFLAEAWGWTKTRVSDHLKAMVRDGRIAEQRAGQHGTIYLLVNYDLYQGSGAPARPELRVSSPAKKPAASKAAKARKAPTAAEAPDELPGASAGETPSAEAPKAKKVNYLTRYLDAYEARNIGLLKEKFLAAELKPLRDKFGCDRVFATWQRFLDSVEPKMASPAYFARAFGTWDGTAQTPTKPATPCTVTLAEAESSASYLLPNY
jgi:hypothetical protein